MKYDDAKVDALIEAAKNAWPHVEGHASKQADALFDAMEALRPKPPKFYVMPEWEDFIIPFSHKLYTVKGNCYCVKLNHGDGPEITESLYNDLREATATDKPMVHIPAGKDWDDDDLQALRKLWNRMAPSTDQVAMYIIDAIKAKLEGRI